MEPVKYHLLKPPYLLKGSQNTEFIYAIENILLDKTDIQRLNSTTIEDRIKTIKASNGKLSFYKCNSRLFCNNLIMIDSIMPLLLSEIIILSVTADLYNLKEIVTKIEGIDPLFDKKFTPLKIYNYKIKEFFRALSLGLNSCNIWNGEPNLYEHLPLFKYNDEIIYYSDDPNIFTEMLVSNCEINKNLKMSDGTIYQKNNKYYLKFPFQINLKT